MAPHIRSVEGITFEPHGEVFPSPLDWRDHFMYQLMLDRFDDDTEHNKLYHPESAGKTGRNPEDGKKFQGGNLKGVTRRLDYIRKLGCTAIWITPPFKQRQDDQGSYHGYAIQDFLSIDPRFGTLEDLQELTRTAHKLGMYVILDVVINHTADVFRYTQDDTPYRKDERYDFKAWHKISEGEELTGDDAVWPIELQDPDAFKRKGSIRDLGGCDEDEAVNGDFFSLKELDSNNPRVIDTLIKCYKYWIASCDVDGFRIDTVRNCEPRFMQRFCRGIHEFAQRICKTNFLIFGEIIGDDDLLHRYIGNNGPARGVDDKYPLLDAALDFPLYGVLDEVIKGQKPCSDLRNRYEYFQKYYREQGAAARYYVTFIDNHDQSHRPGRRFLHGANDWRLGVLGIGYLLCNMGIPCIYYGTEQGFDSAGDNDSYVRECMFGGTWGAFDSTGRHFFNPKNPLFQNIAKIADVRAREPALRYGRQYFRDISDNGDDFVSPTEKQCTLAFSRVFDDEEIVVVINLSDTDRTQYIAIDRTFLPPGVTVVNLLDETQSIKVEERGEGEHVRTVIRVDLGARSMVILKRR